MLSRIKERIIAYLYFLNTLEDGVTPRRISWTKVGIIGATLSNIGTSLAVCGDQISHFFVSTPEHIAPFTILYTAIPHGIAAFKDEVRYRQKKKESEPVEVRK